MIEVLVEQCILLKYPISSVILSSFTRPMYPIVTTTLRLEQQYLFFEKSFVVHRMLSSLYV